MLVSPIFLGITFVVEENIFLTRVERHAFVNSLIKKYSKERDFDYYFSREAIYSLIIDYEKNSNLCLPELDIKPFIF